MGKKDVAKKAATKIRHDAKQKKSKEKQAKKEARNAGEEDIDKILADIIAKEAEKVAVTVSISFVPPSPRANFSMTSLPNGDIVLFGGEYFDGEDTFCYNDLYRWNIEKGEWKLIESPNSPPPRCSHQAVFYKDNLYIFGGEFATSEQFHHYKDLWRLNLKTNAWELLEPRGTLPSARSGHRMTIWRNHLILFGGFYEAARDVRWYNDLYVLNFQTMMWNKIEFPFTALVPSPRSGHQMVVHDSSSTLFLYGGYSKEKESGKKNEGKVHNDFWTLNLQPLLTGNAPVWESKRGNPPSQRSGATMVVHKTRALLFGGVSDIEAKKDEIISQFYNDLYAFDMDRRQWYKLNLKPKKSFSARRKRKVENEEVVKGNENDNDVDEEEDFIGSEDEGKEYELIENTFVYIDSNGKLMYIQQKDEEEDEEQCIAEENTEMAVDTNPLKVAEVIKMEEPATNNRSSSNINTSEPTWNIANCAVTNVDDEKNEATIEVPLPRINAGVALCGNTLYVYGGILEVQDREYTLDDCWSIDLNSRTEWKRVFEGTMDEQRWKEEVESEDSSETSNDSMDNPESEEDEMEIEPSASLADCKSANRKSTNRDGIREELKRLKELIDSDDPNRTPMANETLRDYYARTTSYWSEQFIIQNQSRKDVRFSEKEIRRDAFYLAEQRFQEVEPYLQRLNELEAKQADMEKESIAKTGLKKEKSRR